MLGRSIDIESPGEIAPVLCIVQASAVDIVLSLLGNVGLEWFEIEFVSATSEFISIVILNINFLCVIKTVKSINAQCVGVEFADFGETVAVVVIRVSLAV